MVIGEPVLRTCQPLTTPSVASIAMVQTMPSPKWCATSNTSLDKWSRTSSVVIIEGKPSSNLTLMTTPMTWQTCLIVPFPVNSSVWTGWSGKRRDHGSCGHRQTRKIVNRYGPSFALLSRPLTLTPERTQPTSRTSWFRL